MLAMGGAACFNFFSPSCVGDQCNASASQTKADASKSPSPTPTPIKIDTSCAATCLVHSVVIDEGDSVVAIGQTKTFNLTPFTEVNICDESGKPTAQKKLVKTTEECDNPRAGLVQWVASSNAVEVSNFGFKAEVKRVATGTVILTGSLDGKSFSRTIR
jgi:hypothetical protein